MRPSVDELDDSGEAVQAAIWKELSQGPFLRLLTWFQSSDSASHGLPGSLFAPLRRLTMILHDFT